MWQGTTHQSCWWWKLSFHEPLPTFKKNQTFWVWLVLLKTSESMKRVMNKNLCFSLQGLISAPLAPGSKWRAPEGRQYSSLTVFSLKDFEWCRISRGDAAWQMVRGFYSLPCRCGVKELCAGLEQRYSIFEHTFIAKFLCLASEHT